MKTDTQPQPMLVRGFYYEGWHPTASPSKSATRRTSSPTSRRPSGTIPMLILSASCRRSSGFCRST
jgi:hypothetical protein